MRKFRILLAALGGFLVLLGLCACKNNSATPTDTPTPTEQEIEETEEMREQTAAVKEKIDALREAYGVLEEEYAACEEAFAAYEALTEKQKEGLGAERTAKITALHEKINKPEATLQVRVTDAAYGAKGDGKTNDRAAIQAAIDDVSKRGGGVVRLDAGKTFLTGNLMLRSHVTLFFEDGAVLLQSGTAADFVNPLKNYEPYTLTFGQYVDATIEWNAAAFYNFPFLYAGEGTEDIAILGNGTVEMTAGNDPRGEMTMQAIGLYHVNGYTFADFTLCKYRAYCTKAVGCSNGLYYNLKIDAGESPKGGTDGIALNNCRNIRVTHCNLLTGDDGVYVCSSWRDPREGFWYTTENPQTPSNIEIDHNHCEVTWDATKAFAFIVWGSQYPDQKEIEVSNIYVHDNYFQTVGAWTGNWNLTTRVFDFNGSTNPMKYVRMENNEIGTIQDNFYTLPVSDFYGFPCMSALRNGDFETDGDVYWVSRLRADGVRAGAAQDRVGQTGTYYGYIAGLENGDAALYEGLYLKAGKTYTLTANVQTSGDTVRLFVKEQTAQTLVASLPIHTTAWQTVTLEFTVPADGNYHVGLERGEATGGWARIDDVTLCAVTENDDIPLDGEVLLLDSFEPNVIGSGGQDVLGYAFITDTDGTVPQVRMYCIEQMAGTHTVTLWDFTAKKCIAGPYEWDIEQGTVGWQRFTLPEEVHLEAGKTYALGISSGPNGLYAKGENQLSEAIEGDGLHTNAGCALYSGNTNLGTAQMPGNAAAGGGSGNNNYFRDVVFIPD